MWDMGIYRLYLTQKKNVDDMQMSASSVDSVEQHLSLLLQLLRCLLELNLQKRSKKSSARSFCVAL